MNAHPSFASRLPLVVLFAAASALLPATRVLAQIETRLLPPAANEFEDFGTAISLDGDRLLIGARGNDLKAPNAGIAYLFERQTDGAWVQTATLSASDGGQLDLFGAGVSLDGDRALVGAIFDVVNGYQSGSAYLLEQQADGSWLEAAKLAPVDGSIVQSFGSSVALDGDRALIAADFTNLDNGALERAGAAYVFERQDDGSWIQTAMLTADEPEAWDFFGRSVALEGNRALIGVVGDSNAIGVEQGSAYVFERQATGAWTVAAYLVPGDPASGANFGASVSLDGDRVLIGSNSEQASVYERRSDGTWVEAPLLVLDPANPYQTFTYAVSLSGDRALVGGAGNDESPVLTRWVHLFERRPDGTWPLVARIGASEPQDADEYGRPVAIEGDLAVVAAPRRDEVARGAGAVYVYDLASRSRIASVSLIDADTELPVPGLEAIDADTTLNLNLLPKYLNLRANPVGNVESVRFAWTAADTIHTENRTPYALFGDLKGDYTRAEIEAGSHILLATPYGLNDATGMAGDTLQITLNFVRDTPGLLITKLAFIDVPLNEVIYPYVVQDGDVFDYRYWPPPNFSIRADVQGPVESVRFSIPELNYDHLEEMPPYALFGDINGQYIEGNYATGDLTWFLFGHFTLTVTAYAQPHGEGEAGEPYVVHLLGKVTIEPPDRIAGDDPPALQREAATIPDRTTLESAYPNPFNPTTTLRFGLPEALNVRLAVYDLLGREVERIVDGVLDAGWHEAVFDAGDLPSGLYLVRFETPTARFTRRILLLK
ncbi:MAG: T9SS type A sorting domain-containing protein [Rhodothermales bacterium]